VAGLQLRDKRTASSLGDRFGGNMQVGDLVKRRNNGDLALVLRISSSTELGWNMEVMRCDCGNIQYVWDYQYEVVK